MAEIIIETPDGPETYQVQRDAARAYDVMLSLICLMAVDAGAHQPEWAAELDKLCDAASIAPDDLEAEFVLAAWNDWARDYLTFGETQIRFASSKLKRVAGRKKSKRGVVGNFQIQLEKESAVGDELSPVLRKLSRNPWPTYAQQRDGVGRTIWMVESNDYRIFYVVDEPSAVVIVVDISPIEAAELKSASLGETAKVAYADTSETLIS